MYEEARVIEIRRKQREVYERIKARFQGRRFEGELSFELMLKGLGSNLCCVVGISGRVGVLS